MLGRRIDAWVSLDAWEGGALMHCCGRGLCLRGSWMLGVALMLKRGEP